MKHTISNDKLVFVSDSYQVEPWELCFKDDGVNYFWRPESAEKLGAAVCFPLLGFLQENRYVLNGKEYTMDIHGFAKECDFAVVYKSDSGIVYELTDSEWTRKQYPYRFRFQVAYILEGASLRTEYRVKNLGDGEMHFSVGGHPRYACPVDGGRFEDCYVEFEKPERIENVIKTYGSLSVIEKYLSKDGRRISLDYSLFEKGCFCLHPVNSTFVTLKSAGTKRSLRLESDDTLTHLQFWTSVGGQFLCMEPWYGSITHLPPKETDGDWKARPGTLCIKPGAESVHAYDVTVSK